MAVTAPSWAPLVSFTLLIVDPAAAAGAACDEAATRPAGDPRRRRARWRCCRGSACRRSTTRSSTWCCTGSCSRRRGTSCRATRATSRSATARSSARACTRRPRWRRKLRLAVPLDAAGGRRWWRRCSASALGAVVFRVQGACAASCSRCSRWRSPSSSAPSSSTRRSTAARASPQRGARCRSSGRRASSHLLPAGAGRGGRHAAGRLGASTSRKLRRRPVRDPRRRGRGRGDGRADLPLQAGRARRSRARWPAWPAASMRCSSRT